jgi:integrase
VLHQPIENAQGVRADRPVRLPFVLTSEEVKRVLAAMAGMPQLVAKLLYGSGLRLLEALRLRVQDLDFEMKQLRLRYTHVLRQGGSGIKSPLDCLEGG